MRPIGVFDSGFGGLTVARAIMDQLPGEDMVYLGDTARAPYGTKSLPEVREYALECLDYLANQDVKALVIACNSASSAVLRDARERYDLPIIDVILPSARRAVKLSKSGRIGVVCTQATANSLSYDDAVAAVPDVELVTQPCPRFVEFVEAGVTSGAELLQTAQEYLLPLRAAAIDTLILGCTHYPLLSGVISYVMEDATLVSSAEECAKETYATLTDLALLNPSPDPTRRFLTTGAPALFETLGKRLLGGFVSQVEQVYTIS
ncbi:MAG: glutamate racemase [Propionibacteriaceae bacterium]|jgi:glutamate racemase|nr:glutamate racemase [Propionibacteriaceae bacterium]